MTRARLAVASLLVAGTVLPETAAGQLVQIGVTGASVRVLPEGQVSAAARYTGVVGGGEGRLTVGPVRLEGWYVQGGLTAAGGAAARDLVEGGLQLGADPVSWASFAVGPHVRSYLTSTGTQRWLFWEAHARGDLAIVEPVVRTYVDVWWIAGGSVTGVDGFGSGGGFEGGVAVRLPRTPVRARGGYRVERATLGEVGGGETVERLTFSIGIGLW